MAEMTVPMRLKDVLLSDVVEGKNWIIRSPAGPDPENPVVEEASRFEPGDVGLFSAVAVFADMSRHAALVIKQLDDASEQTDTYVYTRLGWMNIMASGFMRAVAKYTHEIFPMESYLANPWEGDAEVGRFAGGHRIIFRDSRLELRERYAKVLAAENLTVPASRS